MPNLYITIAAELQNKIAMGELKEGEKLLSERTLAKQYCVSRNVIRESLRVLNEKGLVEIQTGKGAFITSPRQKVMEDIVMTALNNRDLSLDDIVETREAIELAAIRKAAQHACKEDVGRLSEIFQKMSRSMESSLGYSIMFADLDSEFHMAIVKASGNQMFETLLNMFYNVINSKQMFWISQLYPENIQDTQKEHYEILQAIIEKDPEKATAMLKKHLSALRVQISALRQSSHRETEIVS